MDSKRETLLEMENESLKGFRSYVIGAVNRMLEKDYPAIVDDLRRLRDYARAIPDAVPLEPVGPAYWDEHLGKDEDDPRHVRPSRQEQKPL